MNCKLMNIYYLE